MKVESSAECSKGSILQYFWPALNYNWSWNPIFGPFESGRFTQVLLYVAYIGLHPHSYVLLYDPLCNMGWF